jgi:hypothetical protein
MPAHLPRLVAALLLFLPLAACDRGGPLYESLAVGTLKGKLTVQWLGPDRFLFIPDPTNPLTFVRNNGDKITPERMLTDGGSIPRPIWILRNYSPWGYAPAFIMHDWLFDMKNCKHPGFERYTHSDAAFIMSEVMKTMMESGAVAQDKGTVASMHAAVSSKVAKDQWEQGKCVPPPAELTASEQPLAQFELVFP